METTTTRPALPPRQARPPASPPAKPPITQVSFAPIAENLGQRTVIFGPGGIGKTTLACTAPGPVAFFDLDGSLPILKPKLKTRDVRVVPGITEWQYLRDTLNAPGWDAVKTIVIDTATRAEELCVAYTLATVPHEKGHKVSKIEEYGYGKGYRHNYDNFLALLADLDQHYLAGRNVILICHDCVCNVANPLGDDYVRWEPRLQNQNNGNIRARVREWADHVLFIVYDLNIRKSKDDKSAKASGGGTRTIYPTEQPHCMAKSRTLAEPLELGNPWTLGHYDTAIWDALFGGPAAQEAKDATQS